MNPKNKRQTVFRGILAIIACSFAIAPLFIASVTTASAPEYSDELQALLAPMVKAAGNDGSAAPSGAKLPDIAAYSKLINIKSFLGKPVRIPIESDNPDKIPGGDRDYVIVYPPQFYQNKKTKKIVALPVKSIYLASGKSISKEKQQEVQTNLENYINYCFCNQDKALTDLEDALRRQASQPKPRSYLDGIFRIFNIVHAEDTTATETAGTTDAGDEITDEDIQTLLDSDDPQMKQMLMLLLLNLLMSQKTAEASNVDKQTCLDNGGDWVNEQCDMGNTDTNDDSDKQQACEDSSGTWKTFTSSRSLCLTKCGMTDDKCQGSGLADFEETEGIIINSGSSSNIKGCKCPEGQCTDGNNACIDDENQNKDEDEDNVPDGQDKCAKSTPDGSGTVNMNGASPYYGCTCSQIQALGGYQQQTTCPPGQCNGPYYTTYTAQQGSCSNGNVTQGQCVADNSGGGNMQMAQQCYDKYQQDQANKQAQDQQKQQALQDLLKQLMGGGKGGGGGGGGDKGGGGGGGCPGGQQGAPQTGTPETSPAAPPKPDAAAIKAEGEATAQKAANTSQSYEASPYYQGEQSTQDYAQGSQTATQQQAAGNYNDALQNYKTAEKNYNNAMKEFNNGNLSQKDLDSAKESFRDAAGKYEGESQKYDAISDVSDAYNKGQISDSQAENLQSQIESGKVSPGEARNQLDQQIQEKMNADEKAAYDIPQNQQVAQNFNDLPGESGVDHMPGEKVGGDITDMSNGGNLDMFSQQDQAIMNSIPESEWNQAGSIGEGMQSLTGNDSVWNDPIMQDSAWGNWDEMPNNGTGDMPFGDINGSGQVPGNMPWTDSSGAPTSVPTYEGAPTPTGAGSGGLPVQPSDFSGAAGAGGATGLGGEAAGAADAAGSLSPDNIMGSDFFGDIGKLMKELEGITDEANQKGDTPQDEDKKPAEGTGGQSVAPGQEGSVQDNGPSF